MMAQLINRRQVKADVRQILKQSDVPASRMLLLFLLLQIVLNTLSALGDGLSIPLAGTFLSILTQLMVIVLEAGFVLYCMAILHGERVEYLALFDGFSFVGKLILLYVVQTLVIAFWSILLVVPGIIAAYRYRFAMYNLYEDPDIGVFEALDLSKRQTAGYKMQLFTLDMSYLPWLMVASFVSFIVDLNYSMTLMPELLGGAFLPALPDLAVILISSIWSAVVAMGYYAHMVCADLEYFRIAKETSGASAANRPNSSQNTQM